MRFITHILDILNVLGMQRNSVEQLRFVCEDADPVIYRFSCANVTVYTTKHGMPHIETYSGLINVSLALQADANTPIIIYGQIDTFMVDGAFYKIASIDVARSINLHTLDVSLSNISELDLTNNMYLEHLYCIQCDYLTSLDLSNCAMLNTLDCGTSNLLEALDISGCPVLMVLNVVGCVQLENIRTLAMDSNVSNEIASIITGNTDLHGTVYCDSSDPYYSTVETAALGAGWNILPL